MLNRKLSYLIPAFLKKIDHQLLLHKPVLWATRFHYLLFFVLMGLGLEFFHLLMRPVSTSNLPMHGGVYLIIFSIIGALGLMSWAWQMHHYRVEAEFGQITNGLKFRNQLLYGVGIVALFAFALLPASITQYQVATVVSNEEFRQDFAFDIGYDKYGEYLYWELAYDVYHYSEDGQYLREAISLMEEALLKYAGFTGQIDEEETILNISSRSPVSDPALNEAVARMMQNKKSIDDAKKNPGLFALILSSPAHQETYFHSPKWDRDMVPIQSMLLVLAFSGLWVLMCLLMRMRFRYFLLAIVASIVLVIAAGFVMSVMQRVVNYSSRGYVVVGLFWFIYGFLVYQVYYPRNGRSAQMWRSIAVFIVSGLSLIVPIIVVGSITEFTGVNAFDEIEDVLGLKDPQDAIWALILMGLGVSQTLWNATFGPQLSKTAAQPIRE